jgi:hypothetical protein
MRNIYYFNANDLFDLQATCVFTQQHMGTGKNVLKECNYLAFNSIHGKAKQSNILMNMTVTFAPFIVGENVN